VYETDRVIFRSGQLLDSLLLITEGEIQLFVKIEGGQELNIDTLYEGCFLGAYSLLSETPQMFFARAKTNVVA